MRKQKQRFLATLLAALMLCLAALPASAATSAKATTMRLSKYTGTVNVTNSSGRTLSKRNNMLLYNGYQVETKAKSYAWINLDDTKLAKLDAVSKAEVRKSGKKLEVLLKSGNIFFNVTEPLDDDETLSVRTSTIIVGIRGTSGFIRVIDRWAAEIYVLEGTVQCDVTDPVTGQVKTAKIHGGEKAIATAYPQDREGDKCDILMDGYTPDDINGFVMIELAQDPGLCGDIYEETGMDVIGSMGVLESVRRQLEAIRDGLDGVWEQFEQGGLSAEDAQAKLDEFQRQLEDLRSQLERADPDSNAQRRLDEAQEHLKQAQEALDNARARDALDRLGDAREKLEGAQQNQADNAQQQAQEDVQDRLEQDEQEMQDKLDQIEDELAGQENNVSSDTVWEQETPTPGTPDTTDPEPEPGPGPEPEPTKYTLTINYAYWDGSPLTSVEPYTDQLAEGEPYSVTPPAVPGFTPDTAVVSGTMPARDLTVLVTYSRVSSDFRMPMTTRAVQDYLAENGAGPHTLLANSDPAQNTLTVDIDWTIPGGTTLNLDTGIAIVVNDGASLTVDGTLTGTGNLTNNGTLTVNSSNTLTMGFIENNGALTNNAAGRIVTNDIYIRADAANSGIIEGGVTVESGTFTMNGGKIDGGTDRAVLLGSNAFFIMNGGEVTSSDDQATVGGDGRLTLTGGTITNDGSGCAVSVGSANTVTIENTVIRAKQKDSIFHVDGLSGPPGGYGRRCEDGYYFLVKADAFGDCGENTVWDYSDGILIISGTDEMDYYSPGDQPWFGLRDDIDTVIINDGVTSIGGSAFYNCKDLTGATIPDSVTSMGNDAFNGCDSLTDIYYGGTEEQWNQITIGSNNDPLTDAAKHYAGTW